MLQRTFSSPWLRAASKIALCVSDISSHNVLPLLGKWTNHLTEESTAWLRATSDMAWQGNTDAMAPTGLRTGRCYERPDELELKCSTEAVVVVVVVVALVVVVVMVLLVAMEVV